MLYHGSSFLNWYPKIAALPNISMPKTAILTLTADAIMRLHTDLHAFINQFDAQITCLLTDFQFPLFIKGDISSTKHDWKNTCFVPTKDVLYRHIAEIMYRTELNNMPSEAIIFRELLPLESPFVFFDGDLPISKERRYFVDQGSVICHHPYWDLSLFEQRFNQEDYDMHMLQASGVATTYTPKYPVAYRNQIYRWIKQLNTETEEEITLLTEMATRVSSIMENAWSVDFACDIYGTWYLIDMGLAKESGHLSSCPHASQWKR